jgi:sirohydrochlorin ferrochelatase
VSSVLLVAHGSRDPAAGRSVESLARAVRRQLGGTPVGVAYLDHGTPDVPTALARLGPDHTVVVLLLLAEGYHSRVDLPGLVQGGHADADVAPVLGPDPLLVEAVDRRLREAGSWPGDSVVVLAAAGSSDPAAQDSTQWAADRLSERGWSAVRPAYLSAATPTVPDAVSALRAEGHRRVVVASYLLSPGRFQSTLDGAGADAVTRPLGAAPEVVDLVLARVRALSRAESPRSRRAVG